MRCEKCGEVYPSKYYFKDEGNTSRLICSKCSGSMTVDEIEQFFHELRPRIETPDLSVKDGKNQFQYSTSFGKIAWCIILTIIALSRVQDTGDSWATSGSFLGAAIAAYLFGWAPSFRLWPWSKKSVIVESDRITFCKGKAKEIIDNIELVRVKGSMIEVEGVNEKGQRVKMSVEKRNFTNSDYEQIKLILLKDKIES